MKESRPLFFEKLSIPVYLGEVTHREYRDTEYFYTEEEARGHLNQKLMDFLADLEEKGVQIIEKNVKIDRNSLSWSISGNFLVREPVRTSSETIRDTGEERNTDE